MDDNTKSIFRDLAKILLVLTVLYYLFILIAWFNVDKWSENNDSASGFDSVGEVSRNGNSDGSAPKASSVNQMNALPTRVFFLRESSSPCDSKLLVRTRGAKGHLFLAYRTSDDPEIACYIPPGQSYELSMPSGTFDNWYQSGERWIDNENCFGADAEMKQLKGPHVFGGGSRAEMILE